MLLAGVDLKQADTNSSSAFRAGTGVLVLEFIWR